MIERRMPSLMNMNSVNSNMRKPSPVMIAFRGSRCGFLDIHRLTSVDMANPMSK